MKITRRTLLTLAGLAALGMTVPACRRMLWQILFDPEAEPVAAPDARGNPYVREGRSLVAIVRGEDPALMVHRALDLLGGLGPLDLRGKHVLVKPNVVSGDPAPTTTDPRVVRAVLGLARAAGAGSLAVGDMSALLAIPSRPHLVRTGIARVAEEAGAEVLAFDEGEWVEVRPPEAKWATTVFVAKAVHEAPVLISVPVVKTHRNATFSGALKNTVGCVHGKNKPWSYGSEGWEPSIAELNRAVRPHFFVVDGLRSMVAGGPWSGEEAATGVMLASADPVALDAVVLGLLRTFARTERVRAHGVWENGQIRRAVELGLGARGPADVALVAEDPTRGDPSFRTLVDGIRREVGLTAA